MIWQKALKYPVLIIGVVWMTIFLSNDGWVKLKTRFYPDRYTCDTITLRIKDKVSKNWKISCPDSLSVLVIINFDKEIKHYQAQLKQKNPELSSDQVIKALNNKSNMYKLLSNSIVKLSKLSNVETMQNVKNLHFYMISDQDHLNTKIHAKTDGAAIVMIREKIYESNGQEVVKKARDLARERGLTDPKATQDLEEKIIQELLDRNAQKNLKQLPELLKNLVRISEERV